MFECLYSIGHPGELAKFGNHGVSLELDELPVLASRFRTPIRESNVIANELKFLFPGKVVVGTEKKVAVTELGCEILTGLADDIVCR